MTPTTKAAPALTPWYPASVKPVRVGLYERAFDLDVPWYSKWDGQQWMLGSDSRQRAASNGRHPAWDQNLPWRGLASDPASAPKGKA